MNVIGWNQDWQQSRFSHITQHLDRLHFAVKKLQTEIQILIIFFSNYLWKCQKMEQYPTRKLLNFTILKNFASRNSVLQFMSFRGESLGSTVKYVKLNYFFKTLNFLTTFLSVFINCLSRTFHAWSFAVVSTHTEN